MKTLDDVLKKVNKDTKVSLSFPAQGMEGYGERVKIIARPLAKRGIATVILMISYYRRRNDPEAPKGHINNNFRRFILQGGTTISEGCELLKFFND